MKHKIFQTAAIIAAVALISGASILATASPGTTTDPLITLSYLNGPFLTGTVKTEINTALNGLNTRLTAAETKANADFTAAQNANSNTFSLKTITTASSLKVPAGSEVLLESGTASFSGGLIRLTGTTNTAASLGTLVANNLYLATEEVTLTVSSGSAKVWVRTAPVITGAQAFGFDFDLGLDPELDPGFDPDFDPDSTGGTTASNPDADPDTGNNAGSGTNPAG